MPEKLKRTTRKVSGFATLAAWTLALILALPNLILAQHENLTTYVGSASCSTTQCHSGLDAEVHASAHYQLKGPTPAVPNLKGQIAGKLGQINDFCTYPDINWLFEMKNTDGAIVTVGCATCHAGMGAKPEPTPTPAQLANIDCLMCHSEAYKRIAKIVDNKPTFIPDPAVITQALATIQKPTKATCLTRCHTGAGGGAGIKQGDFDPGLLDPPRTLDVHMSSQTAGGAGLSCLDCHTTQKHRIAGRGNDIRETDLDVKVSCSTSSPTGNCHSATPHNSLDLNKHTAKVNCTVCHIPAYARNLPTDVLRDFTIPEIDPAVKRYEPKRTLASNVTPTYRWFNGQSYFYEFGKRLVFRPAGSFVMAGPLGGILDSNAKIHAFKLHQANMGYDEYSRRLIPVKSKILWETGDIGGALLQGAAEVGWPAVAYGFTKSIRYMSLHHEVPPKENALQCADCHVSTGRLDFKQLGYLLQTTRNNEPLCVSCHESKTGDFYKIHQKNVDDKKISCTTCHLFKSQPLMTKPASLTGILDILMLD